MHLNEHKTASTVLQVLICVDCRLSFSGRLFWPNRAALSAFSLFEAPKRLTTKSISLIFLPEHSKITELKAHSLIYLSSVTLFLRSTCSFVPVMIPRQLYRAFAGALLPPRRANCRVAARSYSVLQRSRLHFRDLPCLLRPELLSSSSK